jgi:hypothetical protein
MDDHSDRLVESELGLKYKPRAFFLVVPELFHVTQGCDSCMELEGFFRRHLEELRKGHADLIERGAAKTAAEKFEPRTAQGSCG